MKTAEAFYRKKHFKDLKIASFSVLSLIRIRSPYGCCGIVKAVSMNNGTDRYYLGICIGNDLNEDVFMIIEGGTKIKEEDFKKFYSI
jgi:hypothetical protein